MDYVNEFILNVFIGMLTVGTVLGCIGGVAFVLHAFTHLDDES